MQGRSLIRTIDISVAVGAVALLLMLSVFTWMTRQMDRQALGNEARLVQAQIQDEIGQFVESLQHMNVSPDYWLAADSQSRALLPKDVDEAPRMARDTRIATVMLDPQSQVRVKQAAHMLAQLNQHKSGADFVLLGGKGSATIGLVANVTDSHGHELIAIELLDFQKISKHLEQFGVKLLPPATPNSENVGDAYTVLTSLLGDPVSRLGWTGQRFAETANNMVLPAFVMLLSVGFFAMLLLRHHWASAQTQFTIDLQAVQELAQTDPLTKVPNRRALFDHLTKAIPLTVKAPPVSVLLLDLDGFKWVNDALGHRVGDEVIQKAAKCFSETFKPDGFLARLGGDEFVAVVPTILEGAALTKVHEELTRNLAQTLKSDSRLARIGVSVGAVNTVANRGNGDDLVRLADMALYAAKARGRGQAVMFDPSMLGEVNFRRTMERELRAAIMLRELFLHHQPIVDAISGEVRGYESLVRWKHPVRGLIPPSEFIPIAESSDLIIDLGAFVLEQALKELGPLAPAYISVNVTGRQLLNKDFAAQVAHLLEKYGVEASRLCLELTETSLVSDGESVAQAMNALRATGVRFAIDDFGAGYASLGYLLKFKFDILKIDRDFIAALDDKPESPMIVMSVVSLARSLGMQVIGEGVETPPQHRFLTSAGCAALQGYLFGRPVPVASLLSNLTQPENRAQEIQAA